MAKATAACVTAHIVTMIDSRRTTEERERARSMFKATEGTGTALQVLPLSADNDEPMPVGSATGTAARNTRARVWHRQKPVDAQEQHHDHDMGESRLPVEQRQPCQWAPGHGLRFGERRATVSGHPATVLQPADDADSQAAHNESVGNLIIKFGRGIHHPLRLSL